MGKVLKIYVANKGFLFRTCMKNLYKSKGKKKTYNVIQKMDKTFDQVLHKRG